MTFKDDFQRRSKEVEIYFDILLSIDKFDKPKLVAFDGINEKQVEIVFDSERKNLFRASAFLLLYNLVESTIFNSVIAIFDSIEEKGYKYNHVIDEIKRYWLNNIYKHDERIQKDSVINSFMQIALKIFNETLTLASTYIDYGGSLDARNIRATATKLGINIQKLQTGYNELTHGAALKEVCQKRNWLAHGEKSFSEIGQDYDYNQLNDWRNYITEHLERFIESVESYIEAEGYKIQEVA